MSSPTGVSPIETTRAVLPTRPSSASGLWVVRSVRYAMSTFDWATPAANEAASTTGIGGATAMMSSIRPMTDVPMSILRPSTPPTSRVASTAPPSEPTP